MFLATRASYQQSQIGGLYVFSPDNLQACNADVIALNLLIRLGAETGMWLQTSSITVISERTNPSLFPSFQFLRDVLTKHKCHQHIPPSGSYPVKQVWKYRSFLFYGCQSDFNFFLGRAREEKVEGTYKVNLPRRIRMTHSPQIPPGTTL